MEFRMKSVMKGFCCYYILYRFGCSDHRTINKNVFYFSSHEYKTLSKKKKADIKFLTFHSYSIVSNKKILKNKRKLQSPYDPILR